VRNLRVVGDGASLCVMDLDVRWDAAHVPAQVQFANAAPGQYSLLEIELDNGANKDCYELKGRLIGSPDRNLEIVDEVPMAISLQLDLDLDVGEQNSLTVLIDVSTILDAVDWESFPPNQGISLDEGDPENPAIRNAMLQAWKIED
jgi:hypothetical protein